MAELWGFNHITDLCKTLQIPQTNCSCDKLTMFFDTQNNTSFCSETAPQNLEMHLQNNRRTDSSIIVPLLATIIAVLGVVGNTTVVWVQTSVVGVKSKHSALIALLAVCDLLFALLTCLLHAQAVDKQVVVWGSRL